MANNEEGRQAGAEGDTAAACVNASVESCDVRNCSAPNQIKKNRFLATRMREAMCSFFVLAEDVFALGG